MHTGIATIVPAATTISGGQPPGASAVMTEKATIAPIITTFAMGEVDQLDDAVDHRVAERHDGVYAAEGHAVDQLLDEDVHGEAIVPEPDAEKKTAPAGAVSIDTKRLVYFFASSLAGSAAGLGGSAAGLGASAGAAGAAIGAAIFRYSSTVIELPPLMIAIGSILPPFMVKIVISASLRSPLSSNSILPVAPLKLSLASSGRYFAGSAELAFFIASISMFAAS